MLSFKNYIKEFSMDKPREKVIFNGKDRNTNSPLITITMERDLKSVLPKNYTVEDLVNLLLKENIVVSEGVTLRMEVGDLYKYRSLDTSYLPNDEKHNSFQKWLKEKGIKDRISLSINVKKDKNIEVYISKGNHTLFTAMENQMGNTLAFVHVTYAGV